MEYYADRDWTDGLPVVPVTESYLAEFLATTSRDPDEVLMPMPQLNRRCTVRLAAINAALAGCWPDYFPVVLAAWESLTREGYATRGIWQSTTGTAPLLIVNGPVRARIGLNSAGQRVRLGLPGERDDRPGHPAQRHQRRSACARTSSTRPPRAPRRSTPRASRRTRNKARGRRCTPQFGLDPSDSAVTAMIIRSCVHIEARHTTVPEQLALDITGTISRTGALIHETISALVVLSPEHARLFGRAGWGKDDLSRFIYEHAVRSRAELAAVGKDAIARQTRWRLPADHPDAVPDQAQAGANPDASCRVLNSRRRRAGGGGRRQQRGRLRGHRDLRAARRPARRGPGGGRGKELARGDTT